METQTQGEVAVTTSVETTASKIAQKDAVFKYISEALATAGQTVSDLKTMSPDDKKQFRKVVRKRLFESIKSGEVKLSKQYDDSRLKKYCSGLINNWLKKDTRLN